ncbi:Alcohol oxidase [Fulvia fulva]|uniref:Alcohol oxidase n=1 Tax=Passalora fulva TaxID=5499 RepID=A0A9Q8PAG6_PASFU|nr:Alcohol oxidase [Fulvia fulva]KAK4621237.1 Alcohol oxidase [Fulvia fulva]KAK4623445.1 Alcohol oxidase [Fulvia fulva]UJO18841.1 Alcohol oxidase [Fulvia fulva]WPV15734.1 Alcohol oxidase [Fulvia fulva]WPV30728.1 Alcohol oxidase [Fulvia fulva]
MLSSTAGGLAGCVVAGRLAEADKNLVILVIEQGPNNYGMKEVVHPALYPRNLFPQSRVTLFWQTKKSPQLANRSPIVPSGGTLGGGSAMNWMVYTRAQRSDFDSWKTPGWTADEILPFLNKFETYHGKGDKDRHGFDGPVNVSKGTHTCTRAENAFVEAAAKLGYPESNDLQNLDNNDAIERYYKYIGPNGRRQDAAHRFLHPKIQSGEYPNLHVLVEKQVVKVHFDGKRATGVEYQTNPKYLANPEFLSTAYTARRSVNARKLVVVSAGANGTPGVLERSGVGDAKLLEKLGIPVVEDLPGVGEDYQDHHLSLWSYRTNLKPRECINGFMDGRWDVDDAIRHGDELLGTNGMDAQGKFRPTEEEVDALGPKFREAWDRAFKPFPDKPLMILALYTCYYGDHSVLPDDAEYVSMANWTGYPFSRGSVHISGADMHAPVDFDTGWLTDPDDNDVKKHIWAYKVTREMWRRMPIFRGELKGNHPDFPEGSEAAVVEKADGPMYTDDKARIKYTKEDDAAIEQRIREIISTTWHSLGTCKMAPKDQKGVVDGNLSVHGLEGLKLADLSIPPENVGANTGNTAFVIGEKAADIFIKELGIQKVDSPQM